MTEIVGACLSQFQDDENSFELLLAYADGREVGFSVSRKVVQQIAAELVKEVRVQPIDAPALVGSTVFREGVDTGTVIRAAQRCYEIRHADKLLATSQA